MKLNLEHFAKFSFFSKGSHDFSIIFSIKLRCQDKEKGSYDLNGVQRDLVSK